jgi:CheY-like chemotaxis protein
MATVDDLLQSSDKQHLMLLYDDEAERSSAEIGCINRALQEGQNCIYATVDAKHPGFLSKLASRITDYDRQVESGNFVLLNFEPFYEAAAKGDLAPFNQLKAKVEEAQKNRTTLGKNGKTLLVADAACDLARHKQFDECVTLEGWWQETYNDWMAKNLDITIICAHPSSVLKQQPHEEEQYRISHMHSLTLDLNNFIGRSHGRNPVKQDAAKSIRILIAEPEPDMLTLYQRFFKSLPVDTLTVTSAKECLQQLLVPNKRDFYDVIIIDVNVKDASGFDIARRILKENPSQQIILTTTLGSDEISLGYKTHSLDVNKYPTLQKPFVFSQLLGLIKIPKRKTHTK